MFQTPTASYHVIVPSRGADVLTGDQAWLVPGDERNIKITTPQDLLLAESLLARR